MSETITTTPSVDTMINIGLNDSAYRRPEAKSSGTAEAIFTEYQEFFSHHPNILAVYGEPTKRSGFAYTMVPQYYTDKSEKKYLVGVDFELPIGGRAAYGALAATGLTLSILEGGIKDLLAAGGAAVGALLGVVLAPVTGVGGYIIGLVVDEGIAHVQGEALSHGARAAHLPYMELKGVGANTKLKVLNLFPFWNFDRFTGANIPTAIGAVLTGKVRYEVPAFHAQREQLEKAAERARAAQEKRGGKRGKRNNANVAQ